MSRDREAGVTPPGLSLPVMPAKLLLPLALLAAALLAAFFASQQVLPGWLGALAVLLAFAGALTSGAYWSRQRQLDRLREARLQHQLLGQMLECWQWQTDAEHRLTRFQPPQAAPASAWVDGAFSGMPLWERLNDPHSSLRPRMQAHTALADLRVLQQLPQGRAALWRLRGLPRFDGRGRFQGYLGLAEPMAQADALLAAQDGLQRLLRDGPGHYLHLVRRAGHWWLQQASPAAWALLDLRPRPTDVRTEVNAELHLGAHAGLGANPADDPGALPWQRALQRLPEPLRQALAVPQAGGQAEADGWQARWLALTAACSAEPGEAARQAAAAAAAEPAAETETAAKTGADAHAVHAVHAANAVHAVHAVNTATAATAANAVNGCELGLLLCLTASAPSSDSATRALAEEHAAFSYTISHDLRAPIRVVEGFGRILKEDYGAQLDRVGRDHIERIVAAAARMNLMIDALLSLSQLSSRPLARQPVNLSQLAGYVVDDLRRQWPERQVQVHIAPHLLALGDPTLLRMALDNLLGNAWKYSAKNPQAELRFEQRQQGGRPAYCVCDNGAGFDMRFADRLFGVFQRLHSASDFEGTGVGLASVQRIVRRHGGEIWAESEVGQGARFYFTLAA